jgi:hypothetical protein
MKIIIIAVTLIGLGSLALKAFSSSEQLKPEGWVAPSEEEIMRYTDPTACESHTGSLEPRYLAPQ